MSDSERFHFPSQGDFWSQVPVVAFAAAAVIAIVLVNGRAQPDARTTAAPGDAAPVPAACADCGEVIAIRAAPAAQADAADAGVLLEVRMGDGTVRTIRQFAPAFSVGDRVEVNGDALTPRG
jgi:hypothetical protein